jgi:predicted  nucleic acid-binding Zn-ribbon protein
MIKADNQSDKHLTVAGLTVLGDVQSANLQRFEKNLQETFDKTQNLTAQQKEFWKNLADDNLITPVEKKQIKQEIAIIEKTYQALHKKAQEVEQEFNPLFTSYATAYRELKDYIIELKLFDNMNENTRVNKTEFNLKFSDYYEFENVVQSVFLGTPTYTMRVLSGLNDEGTEGEVAIYRNIFYRRENEKWVLITGDTYLGLQKSVPANGSLGDFFLAEEDFTGQIKYKARGKYLKANGKFLTTAKKFKKGFIYKLEPSGWKAVENKNDHRYVIATEDLIEIGETISLHLQKWFTDIDKNFEETSKKLEGYDERFILIDADLDGINEKYQIVDGELKGNKEDIEKINGKIVEIDTDLDGINEQFVVVDGKLVEINGKIVEIETDLALKIEVIPKYLGAVDTLPTTKFKGDWFTWKAESTNEYVKGKVYMWNGEAWKLLDPTDTTNNQQFMTALTDILKTNATGEGYFSTIFASALIASNAFIQNLQSQIITLTQALNADGTPKENTGIIQSKNYLETNGKEGWQIRADGSAEFNGKLEINGPAFVGGDAVFAGSIASGPLYLDEVDPGSFEQQIIFDEGYSGISFYEYCKNNNLFDTVNNGIIDPEGRNKGFAYLIKRYTSATEIPGGYNYGEVIDFLNRKKEVIYKHLYVAYSYNDYGTLVEKTDFPLPDKIIFNKYTPGGKTFKLIGLPTSASTMAGIIYQDSEGYLRIS